jgi:hypothetical protein
MKKPAVYICLIVSIIMAVIYLFCLCVEPFYSNIGANIDAYENFMKLCLKTFLIWFIIILMIYFSIKLCLYIIEWD